jgi:hypothetical protein
MWVDGVVVAHQSNNHTLKVLGSNPSRSITFFKLEVSADICSSFCKIYNWHKLSTLFFLHNILARMSVLSND